MPTQPDVAFLKYDEISQKSMHLLQCGSQHFGVRPVLRIFVPKEPDCTWLCTRITRAPKVVESFSKAQETQQVCTRKNIFCLGVWIFYEWHHEWRTFRPPWPTAPGPGLKPLHGSISVKFLLEIRLHSQSFDTLDDLVGFRDQKLWSKGIKIWLIS